MNKYVAFLRAINVGGHKVKMSDLKIQFEELGFKNIKTLLASGNVIFETDESDVKKLAQKIETKLKEKYDFPIPVIVREISQLENTIKNNPFGEPKDKNIKIYIGLMSGLPTKSGIAELKKIETQVEKFEILDKDLYIWADKTDPKSKFFLTNKTIEKYLDTIITTRNPNTINKIIKLK